MRFTANWYKKEKIVSVGFLKDPDEYKYDEIVHYYLDTGKVNITFPTHSMGRGTARRLQATLGIINMIIETEAEADITGDRHVIE